jgi:hypothetical protein|tara:strand:+ start:81 stop:287 length:207 start_codon:yes stop_codon:yes gene_type:complete
VLLGGGGGDGAGGVTALAGGDYVLSAGKNQAYEFTLVIVNQHKLNEARRRHTSTPSRPHAPPIPPILL